MKFPKEWSLEVEQDGDEESLELLGKVRDNGEHMGDILQKKIGGKKEDE